jgi:hypothetical protein
MSRVDISRPFLTLEGMKPATRDEKKQAKHGLCIWQTGYGLPWMTYCPKKSVVGHLCREHAEGLEAQSVSKRRKGESLTGWCQRLLQGALG